MGAALYIEGTTRTLTIVESVGRRGRARLVAALPRDPRPRRRRRPPGRVPRDRQARRAPRARPLAVERARGAEVRGTNGEELGRIVEIYRAGGAEVFVVRGPRRDRHPGRPRDRDRPRPGPRRADRRHRRARPRCAPVEDDYVRPRDRRPPNPSRSRKPKGGTEGAAAERPPTTPAPTPAAAPGTGPATPADARDRRPHAVPADGRGPAAREHPGADPRARPRHRPRPRPPRVGARPPSDGRRLHVRRRRGHGPARSTSSRRRSMRSGARIRS